MKQEDECFISGPNKILNVDHVVIISELAQTNLEKYIMNYNGKIPEAVIMKLFVQLLLGINFLHWNKI